MAGPTSKDVRVNVPMGATGLCARVREPTGARGAAGDWSASLPANVPVHRSEADASLRDMQPGSAMSETSLFSRPGGGAPPTSM